MCALRVGLVSLSLALVWGLSPAVCADAPLDDASLARAVLDRLDRDPHLRSLGIDVRVDRGVVLLRGSVPTLADALRARALTLNVRGVGLVDTRLDLSTRNRSDRDIEYDVRQRFLSNGDLARADLGITVRSGAVLLTGRVDDMRVRDIARSVAAAVPGVVGIADEIRAPREEGALANAE
ncbi:MAG TPA: BON domain-containing protein [Candidatus Polarisedimenticolaceae bacterium]|nr:BON domain-containing protein [Candidatus Polarisedimenticolaceae bacterium]